MNRQQLMLLSRTERRARRKELIHAMSLMINDRMSLQAFDSSMVELEIIDDIDEADDEIYEDLPLIMSSYN
jgi:hypothetical protein